MAENAESGSAEGIHDAHAQCRLGADHGKVNSVAHCKGLESFDVGVLQGDILSNLADSGIARCAIYLSDLR